MTLLTILHDFEPQDESELPVKAGDIVRRVPVGDGQLEGEMAGMMEGWTFAEVVSVPGTSMKHGWVPDDYVQEISESEVSNNKVHATSNTSSRPTDQLDSNKSYASVSGLSHTSNNFNIDVGSHNSNIDVDNLDEATLASHLTSLGQINMDSQHSALLASVDPLAATLDPLKFQEHSQPPNPPYSLRFQYDLKNISSYPLPTSYIYIYI